MLWLRHLLSLQQCNRVLRLQKQTTPPSTNH